LHPEIKIILYIVFVVFLFFVKNVYVYIFIFFAILISLLSIPFRSLKSVWIPICIFLLFTFFSNVLFQQGRILYSAGLFVITYEGLNIAFIRTMRVFFMVAGAKVLTSTTQIEVLMNGFGNILKPLERLGIPVIEFFSTMGLTMKSLPKLKDHITRTYREKVKEENIKGFFNRAKVVSVFLMPLVVMSIKSPEIFFEESSVSTFLNNKETIKHS
jgi:energy-coupling factor transport system permease protein